MVRAAPSSQDELQTTQRLKSAVDLGHLQAGKRWRLKNLYLDEIYNSSRLQDGCTACWIDVCSGTGESDSSSSCSSSPRVTEGEARTKKGLAT